MAESDWSAKASSRFMARGAGDGEAGMGWDGIPYCWWRSKSRGGGGRTRTCSEIGIGFDRVWRGGDRRRWEEEPRRRRRRRRSNEAGLCAPPDPCPPQYHLGFHPHILPLLYRTTFRFLFFLFFFFPLPRSRRRRRIWRCSFFFSKKKEK